MKRRVSLPAPIATWITQQLPLDDLGTVQIYVRPRIPFWWLMPHRVFSGLTLWNRIYLAESCWHGERVSRASLEIVFHELVHVVQYRRNPLTFPVRYVMDYLKYGYYRNPAEVEARETATRLIESFFANGEAV